MTKKARKSGRATSGVSGVSDLQKLQMLRQLEILEEVRRSNETDRSPKKRSSSGSAGPSTRTSYCLSMAEVMAVVSYACGTLRSLGGPPTEAELVSFLGRIVSPKT